MPEKILITGGGGFLGRSIVEQFRARGDEVRSFSRSHYDELERLDVEQHQGDIRDAAQVDAACRGASAVIHTAALAGIWGRWETFYEINTLGTQHVLDACRKHGVGRLVYTSSPSVTFAGEDQCGVGEDAPYPEKWLAHYPRSKALAEQAVLAAAERGEILACALRPHLIWGPRDSHLIPRLLDRARSGRLRRVGDGSNLVDITYVDNAAEAHLQAFDALGPDAPASGRAYFLSQGEPVNCWHWIDQVLALADLPPVRKSISLSKACKVGAAMETAYRLLRLKGEPPMTRFLAGQLGTSHYFDISRAKEDFGYSPRVSTEEGMRRLGEWIS